LAGKKIQRSKWQVFNDPSGRFSKIQSGRFSCLAGKDPEDIWRESADVDFPPNQPFASTPRGSSPSQREDSQQEETAESAEQEIDILPAQQF